MARNPLRETYLDDGFAGRLKASRIQAGLSQRQVAFPGCTAAYISRLEAGDRVPSMQMVVELARRLSVDPGWLATGKASSGAVRVALDAGAWFQRLFDSILVADENDGTHRLHTDADLYNANVAFREALAAIPPTALEEMYALDELRRVRVELDDCRRRLAAIQQAVAT